MIITFSIENWMSFRDPVSFSMIASRERQHGDRIPSVKKYPIRILPIATIYGGNASGKTNFCKALSFIRRMVIKGMQTDSLIPVEPYRLDSNFLKKPSRFKLELLIDEVIYDFSFAVTKKAVVEEKLIRITSTSEKVLYDRQNERVDFHESLSENQFLNFAFKGTRENQLFLTNSVSQKIDDFRPVYDWFKNTLELIAPDSRFEPFGHFIDEENPIYKIMNELLPLLDTGISHIGSEEMPFDNLSLPDDLKMRLQEAVKEDEAILLVIPPADEKFIVVRRQDELTVKKMVSFHSKVDGTDVKFEIRQESDGSIRVIDLLPVILDISSVSSNKVYIVDEFDRSLHTLLTRQLLDFFLSNCSNKSRSQLLITTHDVLLMDQQFFRRDEMWVAERDRNGASSMLAFSDYKEVRSDKDIRKSYLQGRLGGIPRIVLNNSHITP